MQKISICNLFVLKCLSMPFQVILNVCGCLLIFYNVVTSVMVLYYSDNDMGLYKHTYL